ncbi:MAG: hypothetical protein KJO21_13030 [Verrucomicrobiae bacterium]|nr:hypothetical protein [Verrucomicrobiae bacterium]NNJ44230.1 hypothetical protein [Akkermansiaceae bacterium]
MDKYQSIEEKLSRLIPPSVSDDGQVMLGKTIDELAGLEPCIESSSDRDGATISSSSWVQGWSWKALAAAAAVALLVVPSVMLQNRDDASPALAVSDLAGGSLVSAREVILKSSNRILGQEEDGLIIPHDGRAPHYRYRYHVTDEEQIRDAQTGTIVTLSQPRQEVVTIPVTQF